MNIPLYIAEIHNHTKTVSLRWGLIVKFEIWHGGSVEGEAIIERWYIYIEAYQKWIYTPLHRKQIKLKIVSPSQKTFNVKNAPHNQAIVKFFKPLKIISYPLNPSQAGIKIFLIPLTFRLHPTARLKITNPWCCNFSMRHLLIIWKCITLVPKFV